MSIYVTTKVDKSLLLRQMLKRDIQNVITKTAFDLQGDAKSRIIEQGAVDTGSLLNSIYSETPGNSNYSWATGQAKRDNPAAGIVPRIAPANDMQAIVGVGVEHGVYVEYGAAHMPARPFMTPAAEAIRPVFENAMRRLLQ